jgi:hypothetical protein
MLRRPRSEPIEPFANRPQYGENDLFPGGGAAELGSAQNFLRDRPNGFRMRNWVEWSSDSRPRGQKCRIG